MPTAPCAKPPRSRTVRKTPRAEAVRPLSPTSAETSGAAPPMKGWTTIYGVTGPPFRDRTVTRMIRLLRSGSVKIRFSISTSPDRSFVTMR